MQILSPLHAALLVSDLDQSAWFYGTVLELPLADRPLKFPGLWYQIGTFQIHLIATSHLLFRNSDEQREQGEPWGRNRHLAFAVADLEVVKAQLLAHNCPIQMSRSGRAALFTRDPDGNILEMAESLSKSPT